MFTSQSRHGFDLTRRRFDVGNKVDDSRFYSYDEKIERAVDDGAYGSVFITLFVGSRFEVNSMEQNDTGNPRTVPFTY